MKIKIILTILMALVVIAAGCSKAANTNTKITYGGASRCAAEAPAEPARPERSFTNLS
jgi:hypothetical protein